jgi:hypothetical protein
MRTRPIAGTESISAGEPLPASASNPNFSLDGMVSPRVKGAISGPVHSLGK